MTQEVQPLTWSKRTNIEEHQQFFTKINEIIDNLAPTVEEAEAAIARATAAIASANDAMATANAASAAASAAASQAQTAASTVAGYDTRLTAVEGEADTNANDITALQNVQPDYVKKAGAAQTVTSQIMVPTTATGVRDTQIANGTRIQNDLDAYEAMVRDTGNKHIAGIKTFEKPATLALHESGSNNENGWRKLFISPSFATSNEENGVTFELITNAGQYYGLFSAFGRNGSLSKVVRHAGNFPLANVKMSIDSNNEVILWSYSYRTIGIVNIEAHAGNNVVTFADSGIISMFPEPTTESYRQVITATE